LPRGGTLKTPRRFSLGGLPVTWTTIQTCRHRDRTA
jgi:hypothetical protein